MIIYQRSAGARFPFGIQVIFQTRITRITRILKAALCLLHLIRMEKKRSASKKCSTAQPSNSAFVRLIPRRPRTHSPLNYHL